jgi:methylenetetrahydrofolate dehydrogenase (NADP+)/methenyltetrahydrofolate cyclohydrolase
MAEVMEGKLIAEHRRALLAEQVQTFTEATGVVPHLAAVLVGDDPASAVYVNSKSKACEKAGLKSTVHQFPASTTQAELVALVQQLNTDATVHGILVQLPLPKQINTQTVLDTVNPLKDVDAFHPENVGLLVQGRPRFLPCTPHGIQVLLQEYAVPTAGAHVVVVGRSEIVGKPIGMMLVQKGTTADATVTICHSRTRELASLTRQADILIAAIGKPEFITAEMVKPGATVIDVGINRVNGKLVGDVAYGTVNTIAGRITPVPGGVGPMTIAMLLENTLTAAKIQTAPPSHPA